MKTTYGYWGIDYQTTNYGRLWEIKTVDNDPPDTIRQRVQHTWDTGGNLTQRQDLVASETENFSYDFLDRLTAVSGAYSESFTYNQIGNIATKTSGGTTRTYSYGTKPHAVTGLTNPTASYDYDANGNMLIGTARTWDVENRLTSITKDGVTTDYVYDGDGNRVKKTVRGSPDVTTLYVNRYYEKNLTTSEITTYYYLGAKLVAKRAGTTLNYLLQDHLTGTSVVTDSSGVQAGSIKYFPYGASRNSQGTLGTDLLFTGQRRDIATAGSELYYYGARYYDPNIARFISADTIVPNPRNPQSLNRYSYCLNNPLRYIDPTGHQEEGDLCWSSESGYSIYSGGGWQSIGDLAVNVLTSAYSQSAAGTWSQFWGSMKTGTNSGLSAIKNNTAGLRDVRNIGTEDIESNEILKKAYGGLLILGGTAIAALGALEVYGALHTGPFAPFVAVPGLVIIYGGVGLVFIGIEKAFELKMPDLPLIP